MTNFINQAYKRLNSKEGIPKSVQTLETGVIEFYQGGKTQSEIAQLYGITQSTVSKILKKHGVVHNKAVSCNPHIPRNKP